jgi:hypothetical protein
MNLYSSMLFYPTLKNLAKHLLSNPITQVNITMAQNFQQALPGRLLKIRVPTADLRKVTVSMAGASLTA